MFVKNLSKEVIDFRKNGNVLKLKPGVNQVDENKWSKDDLLNTYGPTILAFFNEEKVEETTEEAPQTPAEEVGKEEATQAPTETAPVETPVVEAPVEEAPVVDTPVVEGEQNGEEGQETPVVEAPVEEAPKAPEKKPATKKPAKKANK